MTDIKIDLIKNLLQVKHLMKYMYNFFPKGVHSKLSVQA